MHFSPESFAFLKILINLSLMGIGGNFIMNNTLVMDNVLQRKLYSVKVVNAWYSVFYSDLDQPLRVHSF